MSRKECKYCFNEFDGDSRLCSFCTARMLNPEPDPRARVAELEAEVARAKESARNNCCPLCHVPFHAGDPRSHWDGYCFALTAPLSKGPTLTESHQATLDYAAALPAPLAPKLSDWAAEEAARQLGKSDEPAPKTFAEMDFAEQFKALLHAGWLPPEAVARVRASLEQAQRGEEGVWSSDLIDEALALLDGKEPK